MEGNISKKRGLVSEITNDDLDYISVKVEATFKKKADADSVYTKSDINSLLDGKQDTLTFDDTPTEGSNNPVKSGGIKTEIDKKADADSVYSKEEMDTKLNRKADNVNEYKGFNGGSASAKLGGAIGYSAIAEDGGAVGMKARAEEGGAVGVSAKATDGGAMGLEAEATDGGAIGNGAKTVTGGSVGKGAVSGKGFSGGLNAKVSKNSGSSYIDAIQLGTGTNNAEKTLQVYDYQLLDADGHIPNDRMPSKADSDSVYTKTETDTKLDNKADKANEYGGFAGGEASNPQFGAAIGKGAATQNGGAVGQNATSQTGGAVGQNAKASFGGGAVGFDAESGMGFAGGTSAKATAQDAIQLGTGTNNVEKTLQVYDYQLMDADGHIPNDRMPTKADKSASIPHTTVSGYPMTVTDHLGGENVLDYKIYGNSAQNSTPAADTPVGIQSVGDLVTDTASEYYGKYDISLYVGGVLTTHIYLNAPLRKVGNSADYIDFKNQKVVRCIKEQTFNGSEAWNYRDSDHLLHVSVPGLASSAYCVSTHFLDENRKDSSTTPYLRPVTGVLRLYQQPSNILWSTAAEFKAFLTAQKTAGTLLIVDYVLSTPTEESISAADFSLPDGEIVSMAAGTETAPSKIDLEYYQDINKVIAEIKAAILSNGGNV
nr:MAG TPA: hypothetical protein [Caudoviricetes sp.]